MKKILLVALPLFTRELTAIKVAGLYGWRLLAPWQLAADYSYDQIPAVQSPLDPTFLGALVLVAAVPALVWWTWRRIPAVALGLGLLALTFAMVSNLVLLIGTIMAERLVYLPSAGFCLAVAGALESVTRGAMADVVPTRAAAPARPPDDLRRLASPALALPLIAVVALYGVRTVSRNSVWRDRATFFGTMVVEAPNSARSHRELGSVAFDAFAEPCDEVARKVGRVARHGGEERRLAVL